MKKYYDYYVNRRNTPHLDLYTKLIGMFYFWNGMNFILGSAYALSIGQKKLAVSGLVLGILMCSLIKDKTTDKRKKSKRLESCYWGWNNICYMCFRNLLCCHFYYCSLCIF